MRLFVAVDVSEEVRQLLWDISRDLRRRLSIRGNWVPKENYHITLMFIGERPEEEVSKISTLLGGVEAGPFKLRLSGIGRFGSRVLWVGVEESEDLYLLAKSVNTLLGGDFSRFHPHITLARIKSRYWDLPPVEVPTVEWAVDRFVLYQSLLSSTGPTYVPVAHFPLKP